MRAPKVPETCAMMCLCSPPTNIAKNAVNSGGTRLGETIPIPLISLETRFKTIATNKVASMA